MARPRVHGYDAGACQEGGAFNVRTMCLAVLFGLCAPVLAQEAATVLPPSAEIEELIVPGRQPRNLRVEIERLETLVYARFNALNSDDEFDIHCVERPPTGSNIPLRTCAPNFVARSESRASEDLVTGSRAAATPRDPSEYKINLEQKSRALAEDMQRVAREDEQFLRALTRLDELTRLQEASRGRTTP